MKYSLRNLFVVVTLVCVALGGRIEYLRRMAVFHDREAEKYSQKFEALDQHSSVGEIYDNYESMVLHRELAKRFRSGVFRPWIPINEAVEPAFSANPPKP
jgi:hypothetical protein